MKSAARKNGEQRRTNRGWANLRPFPKGQSGNPRGRPRLTPEEKSARHAARRVAREVELRRLDIVMMSREHAVVAIRTLLEVAQSGENDDVRMRAAQALLDRGFGKAVESTLAVTADLTQSPERQAAARAALGRLRGLLTAPQSPERDAGHLVKGVAFHAP